MINFVIQDILSSRTSDYLYQKLNREIKRYEEAILQMRDEHARDHVINAAITAWHCAEVFYKENNLKDKLATFRTTLIDACPYMGYMHDLATTATHSNARDPKFPAHKTAQKAHLNNEKSEIIALIKPQSINRLTEKDQETLKNNVDGVIYTRNADLTLPLSFGEQPVLNVLKEVSAFLYETLFASNNAATMR